MQRRWRPPTVRVLGVGDDLEFVVEAERAPAVLGRPVPLSRDVARIPDVRLTPPDVGDGESVLPVVPEAVDVADRRLARLQHGVQPDPSGFLARLGAPIFVHGQPIALLADAELPQVQIAPSHGRLHHLVHSLERHRGRNLDLAPDQGIGVEELDPDGADLAGAVGRRLGPG